MSQLLSYATKELEILSGADKDEMQELMNKSVLAIVKLFAKQNHSGFSASYALGIINKLLKFQPLTPLTGEDDEWTDVGDRMLQNKRCPAVFKYEDGKSFYNDGKVFEDENGSYYTDKNSSVEITFPYIPATKYFKNNEK